MISIGAGQVVIPAKFFGFIVNLFMETRTVTSYWQAVTFLTHMVANPGERLPRTGTATHRRSIRTPHRLLNQDA